MQMLCQLKGLQISVKRRNFAGMKQLTMMRKNILLTMLACLLLAGCGLYKEQQKPTLEGAWTLTEMAYPVGFTYSYPRSGVTMCLIFEGDTMVYACQMEAIDVSNVEKLRSGSDVFIIPEKLSQCMLIDKGGGEMLYAESNGNPHPLTLLGDSAFVMQTNGTRYTYLRADQMTAERISEIRDIIVNDQRSGANEVPTKYVLSTTERELRAKTQTLTYLIIILVLLSVIMIGGTVSYYRRKQQAERQLRQIRDEREQRSQPVQALMKAEEEAFLQSDYYQSLRRRIALGDRLERADWDELEERLKPVYPGLASRLNSLCTMSPVEYRVCLLIKLRVPPIEIANVLSKHVSSISSIRSRLYKKVHQRKGSSKDWDEFVLAL